MPNYSKNIVYLSQQQYQDLITNQSITVDGVTIEYNENDIYVTPQSEPVTDVRVNGTSISISGIANIPVAATSTYGVVKVPGTGVNAYGVNIGSDGIIRCAPSTSSQIKTGGMAYAPIVSGTQHESTFYGLAKAAGADMKDIASTTVGTYPDEQKAAIQSMLGVSSLLAPSEPTLVASKAYAVGDVFTANGKLYKVTTAIASAETIVVQNEGETVSGHNAEETSLSDGFVKKTDWATGNIGGIIRVGAGLKMAADGQRLYTKPATETQIKNGTETYAIIDPYHQHFSTFYGLATAAGDTTQSQSSNAVGTYTDEAKAAIKSMIGVNVEDVQVNGTSVITNGIANISVADRTVFGAIKLANDYGIQRGTGGLTDYAVVACATSAHIKEGGTTTAATYRPIVPRYQHESAFYGLAKASGDTTQSASSNAVGTYTDSAKASIKSMLGIVDGSTGTVDVTGTTPTITAVENTRYVCGEVATLTITPPASGICIIRFTSGTTATVLTATGVIWPEWFDATALEAERVYEICITDGFGMVMSWAQ